MSPPNSRSNPSLQASVAVLVDQVVELKARAVEDRLNLATALKTEQEFNEKTFVTRAEVKPLLALFWTVLSSLVVSLLGVVGTVVFQLFHLPK